MIPTFLGAVAQLQRFNRGITKSANEDVFQDPRLYSGAEGWDAWQAPDDNASVLDMLKPSYNMPSLKLTPRQIAAIRRIKTPSGLSVEMEPEDESSIYVNYKDREKQQSERAAIHAAIRRILDTP